MKAPVREFSWLFLFLDQLRNRLARSRALLYPVRDSLAVDAKAAGSRTGIVGSNLLDIAAIPGETLIAHDDPVKGLFLCSMPAQANGYAHSYSSFSFNGKGWAFGQAANARPSWSPFASFFSFP
jgi:hypothetical protein